MPRVSAVIGFPHGNMSPRIKYEEATQAIEDGAVELDMVMNYGRFLEGHTVTVVHEVSQIVAWAITARPRVLVKAILETCYYRPEQIVAACRLCGLRRGLREDLHGLRPRQCHSRRRTG